MSATEENKKTLDEFFDTNSYDIPPDWHITEDEEDEEDEEDD